MASAPLTAKEGHHTPGGALCFLGQKPKAVKCCGVPQGHPARHRATRTGSRWPACDTPTTSGVQVLLEATGPVSSRSVLSFETGLVLLCNSGCPGTQYVDQDSFELTDPPASAAQVLGIKGVCHHAWQGHASHRGKLILEGTVIP